jgi:hypothetical protein
MQLSRSGDNVKFLGYRKLNNRRGISDVCGVAPNGRSIWIEAKTKDGMVSEDQRDFLDDVHQNGAIAMVARSIEDAAAMVAMQSGSKWKAEMERTW